MAYPHCKLVFPAVSAPSPHVPLLSPACGRVVQSVVFVVSQRRQSTDSCVRVVVTLCLGSDLCWHLYGVRRLVTAVHVSSFAGAALVAAIAAVPARRCWPAVVDGTESRGAHVSARLYYA